MIDARSIPLAPFPPFPLGFWTRLSYYLLKRDLRRDAVTRRETIERAEPLPLPRFASRENSRLSCLPDVAKDNLSFVIYCNDCLSAVARARAIVYPVIFLPSGDITQNF